MTDEQAKNIGGLAYVIFKENPEITYSEAIARAKEIISDEKEGLC